MNQGHLIGLCLAAGIFAVIHGAGWLFFCWMHREKVNKR